MKKLGSIYDYNIGNTPMIKVDDSEYNGNLYIKMESSNRNHSIKDRSAYFMLKSLEDKGLLNEETEIVESTSGNLGLALAFLAKELGIKFTCLVDPTIMMAKRKNLIAMGCNLLDVECSEIDKDYRCARIRIAETMGKEENIIWTNQYANPANSNAHYQTTGPEIWNQRNGQINYVICAMGSGGTISGVAKFIKEKDSSVKIVGVEPYGSTIFSDVECPYLSVGAGLVGKSIILEKCAPYIDCSFAVHDEDAIDECRKLYAKKNISVGITTGMSLYAAKQILKEDTGKNIVIISSDGLENYMGLLNNDKEGWNWK